MNLKQISKDLQAYIDKSIKDGISEKTGTIETYDDMILQFIRFEIEPFISGIKSRLENIDINIQTVTKIQLETQLESYQTILDELIDYINNYDVSDHLKEKVKEHEIVGE
jgi:hypothetical protein